MVKRPPTPIRPNRRTLIVSSMVVPYCRHNCCESNDGEIGFKTPDGRKIDFDYKTDEQPVMMTKDGHGLSYLGHLLGDLKIPLSAVEMMVPSTNRRKVNFQNWGTVISIGSHLSNPVTARILDEEITSVAPIRIKLEFGELGAKGGDKIVIKEKGKSRTVISNDGKVDHAVVVYFRKYYGERYVDFFVLAGLGPQGTRAACFYLATEFRNLLERYPNCSFYQVLESGRSQLSPSIQIVVSEDIHSHITPDKKNTPQKGNGITTQMRFAVALSFSRDRRRYVRLVADALAKVLTTDRVLYDGFHPKEFFGNDMDERLRELYINSELIVAVYSKGYPDSDWCKAEEKIIRKLSAAGRRNVITVKRDEVELPSHFRDFTLAIPATRMSAKNLANLILGRYREISKP